MIMKSIVVIYKLLLLSFYLQDGISKHIQFPSKINWKPMITIASSCLLSITPYDISQALPLPASSLSLEQSVERLEKADSRTDTLQAMADVFEASEGRSLQARTKFKQRIITAVNTQHVKLSNSWDQALGYASGEVKRRVDPYRTVDLGPYLQIAPLVGGACYLGALVVQQTLPELFIFAYPLAVFVFAAPIAFIVLTT